MCTRERAHHTFKIYKICDGRRCGASSPRDSIDRSIHPATHPSKNGSGRKCVTVMASPKALVPLTDRTISLRPWSTARTYVGAIGRLRDFPRVRATSSSSPGATPFSSETTQVGCIVPIFFFKITCSGERPPSDWLRPVGKQAKHGHVQALALFVPGCGGLSGDTAPRVRMTQKKKCTDSPPRPAPPASLLLGSLTGSSNNDFLGPAVAGVGPPHEPLPLRSSAFDPLPPGVDQGCLRRFQGQGLRTREGG